ncbi:hypothetical protein [Arthrobacter sp. H14]|uniref:hypothetical protein n=1 Tax=Arthrobacter sp. H14 TaxID=1312959 RepID=UPI0012DE16B6|nr:hypothetical protein [Arthrobacter sp. H14]
MFHSEQKELLFVVGRRPLYGTPGNLNRARTQKIHGVHNMKGNRVLTMKTVLLAGRRFLSGTAPARHLASIHRSAAEVAAERELAIPAA